MSDRIEYDAEYISYVEHGESAAVFIVRDVVKSIDTRGKWVDVLAVDGEKNFDGQWDFKKVCVELFPRRTKPVYPEYATEDEIRYITWQAAHADIAFWRHQNHVGPKFEVCPKLIDKNAGNVDIFVELWNPKNRQIQPISSISRDGRISNIPVGYTIREKSRQSTTKHDWDYQILSVRRLDEKPAKALKTSPQKPAPPPKKSPVKLVVTSSEKR